MQSIISLCTTLQKKILVNTCWICIVFVIGFKVVGSSSSICFTWSSVIFYKTDWCYFRLQCRNKSIWSNHVSIIINKSVSGPLYYCSDAICCSLPMFGLNKIPSDRTKAKVKYFICKEIYRICSCKRSLYVPLPHRARGLLLDVSESYTGGKCWNDVLQLVGDFC